MEDISAARLVPLNQSRFLAPMRLEYSQGGQDKAWDMVRRTSTVACVIFNTDTEKFIMVEQFRPAVYVSEAAKVTGELRSSAALSFIFKVSYAGNLLSPGDSIDTNIAPGKLGITLELCAGMKDKVENITSLFWMIINHI